VIRRVVTGLVLVFLVACSAEKPVLTQGAVFRDPSAQIASQTNVTADRMAGSWVIRQRFANQSGPLSGVSFSTLPNGALQMALTRQTCGVDPCGNDQTLVLIEPTGPGRWSPVDAPIFFPREELWVMWMDFDSRTAAIGTPSGEFGWIMDKNPTGGGDRIAAARDIMDWFGYDVSQLQEMRQ
jgi:apolipoprotein D and lipocalin family protein